MMARFLAIVWLVLAGTQTTRAVAPDEMLKDPSLEARARVLSAGLRCLVCQNQSIDESHAPLARDLRLLVRERLVAGDTNEQITDYIVARYGEFVLLRPPINAHTIILWIAPGFFLLLGIWFAWDLWRRNRDARVSPASASLSAEDQARLDAILGESGDRRNQ
jgi:cytochrome c-type biogenesis protein CcmH